MESVPAYAQRIYKAYGDQSIEKVKENPYQLAKDVIGIGFKMADAVAIKLGFALHSPERITAGIQFVLWELAGEGIPAIPSKRFYPLGQSGARSEMELLSRQEITALVEKRNLVKQERALCGSALFTPMSRASRKI